MVRHALRAECHCAITLVGGHGRLLRKVARAGADRCVDQTRRVRRPQRRSHAGIDHFQRKPMLTAEHVDGRTACDEIQHHLRRHRLRIGAHARMGDTVVRSEHHHRRAREHRRLGVLDQADLHGQRLQPTQRTQRLGLAINSGLQAGTQHRIKRRNLHG